MRHIIFASILLTLSACNPCDIEVVSDTAFIAPGCPQGTDTCNEAHECVKKGSPPTCIAVPQGGEAWGPCFIGSTCNPGAECHDIGPGNVCVPPCADDTCPAFKCLNGTCDAAAECTPTCATTEDCPIDGMFCFSGECLYPAFAPMP